MPFLAQSTWIISFTVILFTVSTVCFAFRIHVRNGRGLRWADYVAMVAWLTTLFYGICSVITAYWRATGDFRVAVVPGYLFAIALSMSTPFTKISIILQLMELSPALWHRRCMQIMLAIITLSLLTVTFGVIFVCTAKERLYTLQQLIMEVISPLPPGQKRPSPCEGSGVLLLILAAVNAISDLSIFLLAIPFVRQFKGTTSQKWSLTVYFALGFFTMGTSIVAIIYGNALYFKGVNAKSVRDYATGTSWQIADIYLSAIFANTLPLRGTMISMGRRWIINARRKLHASEISTVDLASGSTTSKNHSGAEILELSTKRLGHLVNPGATATDDDDFIPYIPPKKPYSDVYEDSVVGETFVEKDYSLEREDNDKIPRDIAIMMRDMTPSTTRGQAIETSVADSEARSKDLKVPH